MSASKAAGAATVTSCPARRKATPRPIYGSTSPRDPRARRVSRKRRFLVTTAAPAPAATRPWSPSLRERLGLQAVRREGDGHRSIDLLQRQIEGRNGELGLGIAFRPRAQFQVQPVIHEVIAVDGDGIAAIGADRLHARGCGNPAHFKGIRADRHPLDNVLSYEYGGLDQRIEINDLR